MARQSFQKQRQKFLTGLNSYKQRNVIGEEILQMPGAQVSMSDPVI